MHFGLNWSSIATPWICLHSPDFQSAIDRVNYRDSLALQQHGGFTQPKQTNLRLLSSCILNVTDCVDVVRPIGHLETLAQSCSEKENASHPIGYV
jgi:hypothetical protein